MNRFNFANSNRRTGWTGLLFCLAGLSICAGCTPLPKFSDNWFTGSKNTETVVPDRLLPIWTDTVLHQPGEKGVRGFGGRIYFYEQGNEKPVTVDGNVTVYVFDGDHNAADAARPLKKYIVTADQLKDLASTSKLGISYNIWSPWEEVGGASQKLNLIARFDGTQGGTVISSSATKLLPGIDSPADTFESQQYSDLPERNFAVQQANFVEPEEVENKQSSPETTIFSIDLPSSLERKINAADMTGAEVNATETDIETSRKNEELDPNLDQLLDPTKRNLRFKSELKQPISQEEQTTDLSNSGNRPTNGYRSETGTDTRPYSNTQVSLGKVGGHERVIGQPLRSHSGFRRFRARSESTAPQGSSGLRTQPHRATWQNGLPPTPRSIR